ncbi:MAG: dihydrolipoyl dehydrogenase [Bdellovibrionaceae bacterium]|nr:dihydrolipoyl dehydrogenase [Pseudobdellovibrionaceae bacterium]
MSNQEFDVVVIGSGPGGYIGAIRMAQLGLKTAVIEKDATFGGTCLNVGCIPSKALLESSEYYSAAKHDLQQHGVEVSEVKLNLKTMLSRKDKIVSDLTGGIKYLFDKNKITSFQGTGKLKSANKIEVHKNDGSTEVVSAKNIVLATGSIPNTLPGIKYDGKKIITSTEALNLDKVPKKMIVIGAGAIGLEMGSVWARLGTEVTIIEYSKQIGGPTDSGIAKRFLQILKKQGLNFVLEAKVSSAVVEEPMVKISYESLKDGKSTELHADVLLVAAGRIPFSDGLGLENLGIEKNQRGFVVVDSHYRTNHPHIYAIGDLTPGPMLAHKAEEEGVAVAEIIAGQYGHVNYETVPSVIYTWPELASVGATEEQLKEKSIEFNSGSFPFTANGRAKAMGMTDGIVKILADKTTDRILGVHILGPRASDLISEAVVAMEFGGSSEDLARSFHAHPTLSEVLREAALNVDKRARQM